MKVDWLESSLPYAFEIYRLSKGLTGYDLAKLFDQYDIWSYIIENKKNFSMVPERYIVWGIDGFLAKYGVELETQIQL